MIAIRRWFSFTSSRFELLQTCASRGVSLTFHTSPPGFPSSCDSVPPGEGVGSTDWRVESSRSLPTSQPPHRSPFRHLTILFQTSIGLARYADAPCRPLDALISYLIRFLMRRLPSEDGFLFTSSRLGLLRTSVPERGVLLSDCTSTPGISSSFDLDLPEQECDIAVTPVPLRSGSSIAAFPFPGPVSTAVFTVPR